MIYICIPSHNEERTVGVLLWKIRQVLTAFPRDYQLLVLDDGSDDRTPEVLAPYARILPLTVLRHERRKGYAASLDELLREAVRRSEYPRRDVVVTLQADFTEEPDDIPALLKRIESGADVVTTRAHIAPEHAPRKLRWMRSIMGRLVRRLDWPEGVTDVLSGLRAYRVIGLRKALEERNGDRLLVWHDAWSANAALLRAVKPFVRRIDEVAVELRPDRRQRESRFEARTTALQLLRLAFGRRSSRVVPPREGGALVVTASELAAAARDLPPPEAEPRKRGQRGGRARAGDGKERQPARGQARDGAETRTRRGRDAEGTGRAERGERGARKEEGQRPARPARGERGERAGRQRGAREERPETLVAGAALPEGAAPSRSSRRRKRGAAEPAGSVAGEQPPALEPAAPPEAIAPADEGAPPEVAAASADATDGAEAIAGPDGAAGAAVAAGELAPPGERKRRRRSGRRRRGAREAVAEGAAGEPPRGEPDERGDRAEPGEPPADGERLGGGEGAGVERAEVPALNVDAAAGVGEDAGAPVGESTVPGTARRRRSRRGGRGRSRGRRAAAAAEAAAGAQGAAGEGLAGERLVAETGSNGRGGVDAGHGPAPAEASSPGQGGGEAAGRSASSPAESGGVAEVGRSASAPEPGGGEAGTVRDAGAPAPTASPALPRSVPFGLIGPPASESRNTMDER